MRDLDFTRQEDIIVKELENDLLNLQKELQMCENKLKELQKQGFDGVEKFCDEIFSFIKNGHSMITGIVGMFENLDKRIKQIEIYFDFSKFNPEQFLKIVNQLINQTKESIQKKKGNKKSRKIINSPKKEIKSSTLKFKSRIQRLKNKNLKKKN